MLPGKLIVISAPSGSGKTTIAKEILRRNPGLKFSVSATTRMKRAGEVEGRDYFFLTQDDFKRRREAGEFIEWEEMYGDFYGTLKSEVDGALASGRSILFDVDVKGGLSIKNHYPEALLIFIRPPSFEALKARLVNRKTESAVTLQRRLERVSMEMELGAKFDHEVVNDNLDKAVGQVQSLVEQHFGKSYQKEGVT